MVKVVVTSTRLTGPLVVLVALKLVTTLLNPLPVVSSVVPVTELVVKTSPTTWPAPASVTFAAVEVRLILPVVLRIPASSSVPTDVPVMVPEPLVKASPLKTITPPAVMFRLPDPVAVMLRCPGSLRRRST